MKSVTSYTSLAILASALGAVVECAPTSETLTNNIFRRQEELYSVLPENVIKKAHVQSVRTLPAKLRPNAIRKQIRFGPFLVPGSKERSEGSLADKEDIFGSLSIVERIESLCGGDCLLLTGGAVPEFENGTAISALGGSIYNHHIFATNRDRKEPGHICPGDSAPQPKAPGVIIGGGTDQEYQLYTTPNSDFKSGYEVKKTDKIDLVAEFMNYRLQGQKINIAIDFEYLPGKPEGYLSSQVQVFSAAPCNQTSFNVPTKQFTTASKEWIVPVNGYIINIRGHEHDGGTGVHIFVNGKNICSSLPTYTKVESHGESEVVHFTIKEMSLCQTQHKLAKGDALMIRADYDTEKYPQRQSNMGHMETVAAFAAIVLGLPSGYELP